MTQTDEKNRPAHRTEPAERQTDAIDLARWTRMTTIDEPRLSELVELYEELGFEVLLRPAVLGEAGSECLECFQAQPERYRTIYVRPAPGRS